MRPVSKFIILCLLQDMSYSNSINSINHLELNWAGPPISWSDDQDLFFDRIVPLSITIPNYKNSSRPLTNIGISCLIDENRVLTAYHPFRHLIQDGSMMQHTVATVLQSQRIPDEHSEFTYKNYNISCGRQVVYLPDEEIAENQWHGMNKTQSPVHDLMVLRIDPQISRFNKWDPDEYMMSNYYRPAWEVIELHDLVFKTELAYPNERIEYPVKIGTLHYTYDEFLGQQAQTFTFDKVTGAILDCEDWLPKGWGHFICIANDKKLKILTAGAMLVSKNKLFGVGYFGFFKGDIGVLVFTDVRPYYELIMNACTDNDTSDEL